MRPLTALLLLLFSALSLAQEPVVVETNPRNPVKGEVFQILFKCQTTGDSDPEIEFTPQGFEVLGRQVQGLSTRTIYQMGKITTHREVLVSYDARAPKSGIVQLRDVVVRIDGRVERAGAVSIGIVEAPPEPRLVFIAAEVPKKSVYVGEGVVIRYHVYAKTALQAFDIKKYPKLDGFMKRYLQENENVQRVTVDGDLFRRSLVYSARVYPERAGKLVIDPMEISATYSQDLFGNMGFGFGMGMRDMKTKLMSSDPVEIQVKALPEAGKPDSFTGLVGRHEFDLKIDRDQLLVNEPLDVRLTVTGQGALETYQLPELWNAPQIEKFDSKADLTPVGADSAIKRFDVTYLGKSGGEVAARRLEFSYFDPDSGRYEKIEKTLPRITVAGGGAAPQAKPPAAADPEDEPGSTQSAPSSPGAVTALNPWWAQMSFWWTILGLSAAGVAYWKGRELWGDLQLSEKAPWEKDLSALAKGQFTLGQLVRLLFLLSPESSGAREAIQSSSLDEASKGYFQMLLAQLEKREFTRDTSAPAAQVDGVRVKALKKALKEKHANL